MNAFQQIFFAFLQMLASLFAGGRKPWDDVGRRRRRPGDLKAQDQIFTIVKLLVSRRWKLSFDPNYSPNTVQLIPKGGRYRPKLRFHRTHYEMALKLLPQVKAQLRSMEGE